LVDQKIVKDLLEADLRDRKGLLAFQANVDVAIFGSVLSPVRHNFFLALAPLNTRRLIAFDPAKAKDISLTVRTPFEKRQFKFEKLGDKSWKDNSPGLSEFQVDAEKITKFLEQMAGLDADRFVHIQGIPVKDDDKKKGGKGTKGKEEAKRVDLLNDPEFKFAADKAKVLLEITMEDKSKVTLIVGGELQKASRIWYVHSSLWPGAVFVLSENRMSLLEGSPSTFAKDRTVAGASP
jgi:hypothetical protein